VSGLVRRVVEHGVAVVFLAACLAPHGDVSHTSLPVLRRFPGRAADAREPGDFLRYAMSKRMPYGHCPGLWLKSDTGIR
jgi:hypothetical protein